MGHVDEMRSRQAGPGTVLGGILLTISDLDLKCHGKTLKDLQWGGRQADFHNCKINILSAVRRMG